MEIVFIKKDINRKLNITLLIHHLVCYFIHSKNIYNIENGKLAVWYFNTELDSRQ